MLIQFSVENFRSFNKKVSIGLAAGTGNELEQHLISRNDISLLKTAVIYGANASGKSNLLKALAFMKQFVISSMKAMQSVDEIPVIPFLLNSESQKKPSTFEIVILIEKTIYRYGFSADRNEVTEEWLYERQCRTKAQEVCLFQRTNKDIVARHVSFKEGKKSLDEFLGHNVLYLSMLDRFNGTLSKKIMEWFKKLNSVHHIVSTTNTIELIEKGVVPIDWINRFIQNADVGIKAITIKKEKVPSEDEYNQKNKEIDSYYVFEAKTEYLVDRSFVKTNHIYFDPSDKTHKTVLFDMNEHESEGTKKILALAGPVYLSLARGEILIIDEIEASLHPKLTDIVISLFQSQESNNKGAQLIFTTHNTGLLTNDRFRRDEVWFTEKDDFGATDLYSLIDYSPRKDASYDKNYLRGKYGALPFVNLEDFIASFKEMTTIG